MLTRPRSERETTDEDPAARARRSISLVIADAHPITLEGLEQVFESAHFKIKARCTDGLQALQALRKHRPDVFVFGLRLSRKDGLAVLREIKRDRTSPHAVLFTDGLDEARILEARRLGVRGVVLKAMPSRLLIECIRKVCSGQEWPGTVSARRPLDTLPERQGATPPSARDLTNRELDIIRLVAKGLRNKGIAEQLAVTEGTVKLHLHHIYKKLQLDSRLALILYAQKRGFV